MNLTKAFILNLIQKNVGNFLSLCNFCYFFISEARGKLKKLLVPLLLALKFKSAVILPVVFTILALISLKALKVGLVALLIAGEN